MGWTQDDETDREGKAPPDETTMLRLIRWSAAALPAVGMIDAILRMSDYE